MKVIIPMAGLGSRFSIAGFENPKPFIDIDGKPMIRHVVDSLGQHAYEHIFLVREEHLAQFNMAEIFPDIEYTVIPVKETTGGAAMTVALCEYLFEEDDDILVVNSDQLFVYDTNTVEQVRQLNVQGCLWCFEGYGDAWSYVTIDDGYVTEVAEKRQISNIATGGMYYWKSFKHFMVGLKRMMALGDKVNNEYYVAPVYNYMDPEDEIIICMLEDIVQLGTPEELKVYADKIHLH